MASNLSHQDKVELSYSLLSELQNMIGSREEGYGLTNEQLEKLAEKSGVKVEDFNQLFGFAGESISNRSR